MEKKTIQETLERNHVKKEKIITIVINDCDVTKVYLQQIQVRETKMFFQLVAKRIK